MKTSGVKKSVMITERRKRALKRLIVQKELGKKKTKEGKIVKLSDKDIKRIEKEIKTLKERL